MSHYRAYLMDGDHIMAPEDIEASSDADAMLTASGLLPEAGSAVLKFGRRRA